MSDIKRKSIQKIVITGGPCAGKTTALSRIQDEFSLLGYTVLFVAETATELIEGGVAPWTCSSVLEFQKAVFQLQLEKERVFEQAASTMDEDKILIVCDRGTLDNKAYISEEDFGKYLDFLNQSEVEQRDSYDAVFHLVTAAKGAREYYTTENNSARTETIEEAARLDDKLISAWTGHPHFRVIDNSTDFDEKMHRLLAEISSFLGEPEPYEIERKYLIEYPDLEWLEREPNCQRVEIVQTYLKPESGDEVRVRQRGLDGSYVYTLTIKRAVSAVKRVEIERRLTQKEYQDLLMDADPTRQTICKNRYCLTYEGQYFEIDVYPFWDDQAIAEIELRTEDQEITFPPQIRVIKEVTGDPSYKNENLAKR